MTEPGDIRTFATRHGARLAFTALGLGAAPLGNMHVAVAEKAALDTVKAARRLGLRYFDVAPLYGLGLAEQRLGAALKGLDHVIVSTKVGRLLEPRLPDEPAEGIYVETPACKVAFDYSYDGVMRSLEASLERLGRTAVDIVFVHDVDAPTHGSRAASELRIGELMGRGGWRALDDLRAGGAVKAIGAGVNECAPCERLLALADPDLFLLAGRYSLIDPSALASLLPACEARGVGVVIGGPFNSGVLATGPVAGAMYDYAPATPPILAKAAALERVCTRHGVPLPAAALQFALAGPAVACVVAGARSAAEVEANAGLLALPIPADLWAELKAEALIPKEAPTPC